jgi:hypothetical protein
MSKRKQRPLVRQAITTKYIGATNTRGSRVKATSGGGLTLTIPYDHSLDTFDAHLKAAVALARKYKWIESENDLVAGGTKTGYVFVLRK